MAHETVKLWLSGAKLLHQSQGTTMVFGAEQTTVHLASDPLNAKMIGCIWHNLWKIAMVIRCNYLKHT